MLRKSMDRARKKKLRLAPFVGIACPGLIGENGSIQRGGQNLSGNWESKRFNLPRQLAELILPIGEHYVLFMMHNDAVVQGLSKVPCEISIDGRAYHRHCACNAHFTSRRTLED